MSVSNWILSLKKGLGRVWQELWMYMTDQFKMFRSVFNGLRSISEMSIQFHFYFLQEIKDTYEIVKVEVQSKEFISKEDIQEFLVKQSMDFSHYIAFVHKFVVDMEKFKECNLTLDVKKEQIFNSQEQRTLTQHEAWSKYFQNKGG